MQHLRLKFEYLLPKNKKVNSNLLQLNINYPLLKEKRRKKHQSDNVKGVKKNKKNEREKSHKMKIPKGLKQRKPLVLKGLGSAGCSIYTRTCEN